jgi:hypothetical protein
VWSRCPTARGGEKIGSTVGNKVKLERVADFNPKEAKQPVEKIGPYGGQRVPDVLARSEDASALLEGDEASYRWIEAQVPVKDFYDQGFRPAKENPQEKAQRMAAIDEWASKRGGIESAIRESPIVALHTDKGLDLVDGGHRLERASQQGAKTITVLLGEKPPGAPPPTDPRRRGVAYVPPLDKPAKAIAAAASVPQRLAKGAFDYWSKPLVEAVEGQAGERGKVLAKRMRAAADESRNLLGRLHAPLTEYENAVSGAPGKDFLARRRAVRELQERVQPSGKDYAYSRCSWPPRAACRSMTSRPTPAPPCWATAS